jgi:hypothetical protein
MRLPPFPVLPDEPAVDEIVRGRIRSYARDKGRLHILEAGCGRRWPYRFDDVAFVLTGVDLDAAALRIRQEERQDLHGAVVGDLRSVQAHGLTAEAAYGYGILPRFQLLGTRLVAALSGGRLTAKYYNLMYILESQARPATASASRPTGADHRRRSPGALRVRATEPARPLATKHLARTRSSSSSGTAPARSSTPLRFR